jgi:hypothetical protein
VLAPLRAAVNSKIFAAMTVAGWLRPTNASVLRLAVTMTKMLLTPEYHNYASTPVSL